jgi:hypothetical protein
MEEADFTFMTKPVNSGPPEKNNSLSNIRESKADRTTMEVVLFGPHPVLWQN